ncbi:MAG TPA: hypothetical protein VF735_06580 [Pyrinomonadaceae bacterium]|jgi:hypothetical protein
MSELDQEIKVKIAALVKGLDDVRALSRAIQTLRTTNAQGISLDKSFSKQHTSEVRQLAGEIRNLSAAVEKVEPSKLQKLGTFLGVVVKGLEAIKLAKDIGLTFDKISSAASGLVQKVGGVRGAISAVVEKGTELATQVGAAVKGGFSALGDVLGDVGGKITGLIPGLGGAGAALGTTGLAVTGLTAGVVALGAAVFALVAGLGLLATVGVAALTVALLPLLRFGVDYNSNLEQTKLGIASLIASLAELRGASGIKIEGADKLTAALQLAGDQLEKLKVDAIETTATFEEIAPAFQSAIGPGLSAGLSLDQVREIVIQITQAAGAMGVPFNQLNQEVRAILEGNIDNNARIAKALGISEKMVKQWKQQGTLAEELGKRLEQFKKAGDQAALSFSGLTSNLQEAFNVFAGQATERAFNALKERFKNLLPQLFDFKNARLDRSFTALSDLIDGLFVRAIGVAGDFIQFVINGVKSISRFIDENRTQINQILDLMAETGSHLVQIAATLVRVTAGFLASKAAMELIRVGVILINFTLLQLEVLTKSIAFSFQAMSTIVGGSFLASLRGALLVAQGIAGALGFASAKAEGIKSTGEGKQKSLGGLTPAITASGVPTAPAGGKGSKSDKANQERIRQLELLAREAERIYRNETEKAENEYNKRLISLRDFVVKEKAAEQKRFEAKRDAINAQKRLVDAGKQAELDQQLVELQDEKDRAIRRIEQDAKNKELEATRERERRLLEIYDTVGRQRIERIQDLADQRVLSTKTAESLIGDIELAALDRKKLLLRQELERAGQNLEEQKKINGELGLLEVERGAKVEEVERRIATARRRELEERRAFVEHLRELEDQNTRDALEVGQARIDDMERLGESRDRIMRAQIEHDVADEILRHKNALEAIAREFDEGIKRAEGLEELNRLYDAIQVKRQIAQQRHEDELTRIQARAEEERRRRIIDNLKQVASQLTQIFQSAVQRGLDEGFKGFFKEIVRGFADMLKQMALMLIESELLKLLAKVFGVQLPGQQQQQGGGLGGVLGGILGTIFKGIFGGGSKQSGPLDTTGVPLGNEKGIGSEDSSKAFEVVGSFIANHIDFGAGKTVHSIDDGANQTSTGLDRVVEGTRNIIAAIYNTAPPEVSLIGKLLTAGLQAFGQSLGSKGSGAKSGGEEARQPPTLKTRRASGGLVDGPGTETSDSIPAWLSKREFVVKARSVRSVGVGVLRYINSFGRLPQSRFASGGLVGATLPEPQAVNGAGQVIQFTQKNTFVTPDAKSFKEARGVHERELARATRRGFARFSPQTT